MLQRYKKLWNLSSILNVQANKHIHTFLNPLQCQKSTKISNFSKYEPFSEEQSSIIFDVEEEKKRNNNLTEEESVTDKFHGISKERGKAGVIDIEELALILQNQNAVDLFVARIPEEYRYVQYMVIANGKSVRHMIGMVEYVRQVYKYKMTEGDHVPHIEGKKSQDWIAIDLGNIALHIFSSKKRKEYDLDSLWAVGSDFDKMTNEPNDVLIDLIESSKTVK